MGGLDEFGWQFSLLVIFGFGGYCIGGAGLNRRRGRVAGTGGLALERALGAEIPHRKFWIYIHGLVLDGVSFSRGRATAGRNSPEMKQSLLRNSPQAQGGSRCKPATKANKAKKSKRKKQTGTASVDQKKADKPRSGSQAGTGSRGWTGNSTHVELNEERDQTVHSSQAKVTVISLTS